MSYYYQYNSPSQGGLIARGALDSQLKELKENYLLFIKIIKDCYPENKREKAEIFIAQIFLGSGYEIITSFLDSGWIKRKKLKDSPIATHLQNPIFNFLRHCRNAVFHNNKFMFREKMGNRKATWKDRVITEDDEGKTLFTNKLGTNEVIPLLDDVIKETRI